MARDEHHKKAFSDSTTEPSPHKFRPLTKEPVLHPGPTAALFYYTRAITREQFALDDSV